MKRTPLRRISKKRALTAKKRREFVREQLGKRTTCEAGEKIGLFLGYPEHASRWPHCEFTSTELHEPLTRARAPGLETILDTENSVAICRACHRYVHQHPQVAESIGLLTSSRGK